MGALSAEIERALGGDDRVAIVFDGTPVPKSARTRIRINRRGLRHLLWAPGEIGLGRAYAAGDIDLDGDIYEALSVGARLKQVRTNVRLWGAVLRALGPAALVPPRRPPEEARLSGRRHSIQRDRAAISFHYDLSNEFYRLVLGPSLTYSCAVFNSPADSLEAAQGAKHDLVATKLDLRDGMRILDVGCGWGSMVIHAAARYGVQAVGVTLSRAQAEMATARVAEANLSDRVEIRLADYREVDDGPFDAITSIGMFEHVGAE